MEESHVEYQVATELVTEKCFCLFNLSASQYMQCSLIKLTIQATSVQVLAVVVISPFTSLTFRPILLYFLPTSFFFFVRTVDEGKDTTIIRAMVQAVSTGPVTTKAWVQSRAIPCKTGRRNATSTCLCHCTSIYPCQYRSTNPS
jgi:hypothetical protein